MNAQSDKQPFEDWDQLDHEVALICWSMQRFQKTDPRYQRMFRIWEECSLSGALRENFPPGTEPLKADWEALVSECRRMNQ